MEPNQQINLNTSFASSPIGFQMLCEEQRRSLQLETFEDDFLRYFCELEHVSQAEILQMIKAQQMIHDDENDETEDESSEMQQLSVIDAAIGNTFDDRNAYSSLQLFQNSEYGENEEYVHENHEYFDDDMDVE